MFEVLKTAEYDCWIANLRDQRAIARINTRVRRLELGNPGAIRPVGCGISEMKIDYGPGYRVYFKQTGTKVVLLLCGGDKSTQAKDITHAQLLAGQLED
jgi:putative addiction module killer protein